MTQSGLRVGIPFAKTVEQPSGLTDLRVRLSQADRPMPNRLTFLRWDLGHIVIKVPAAEGPGEPTPAHSLRHVLPAQLLVGGNTEICSAFAFMARNVCAQQPIQNLARLS